MNQRYEINFKKDSEIHASPVRINLFDVEIPAIQSSEMSASILSPRNKSKFLVTVLLALGTLMLGCQTPEAAFDFPVEDITSSTTTTTEPTLDCDEDAGWWLSEDGTECEEYWVGYTDIPIPTNVEMCAHIMGIYAVSNCPVIDQWWRYNNPTYWLYDGEPGTLHLECEDSIPGSYYFQEGWGTSTFYYCVWVSTTCEELSTCTPSN